MKHRPRPRATRRHRLGVRPVAGLVPRADPVRVRERRRVRAVPSRPHRRRRSSFGGDRMTRAGGRRIFAGCAPIFGHEGPPPSRSGSRQADDVSATRAQACVSALTRTARSVDGATATRSLGLRPVPRWNVRSVPRGTCGERRQARVRRSRAEIADVEHATEVTRGDRPGRRLRAGHGPLVDPARDPSTGPLLSPTAGGVPCRGVAVTALVARPPQTGPRRPFKTVLN